MATKSPGGRMVTITTAEERSTVLHMRGQQHTECVLCAADRQLVESRHSFNLAIAGARTDEASFIEGFDLGLIVGTQGLGGQPL